MTGSISMAPTRSDLGSREVREISTVLSTPLLREGVSIGAILSGA